MRRRVALIALLSLTLAIAACGDDDDTLTSAGTGDETRVDDTVPEAGDDGTTRTTAADDDGGTSDNQTGSATQEPDTQAGSVTTEPPTTSSTPRDPGTATTREPGSVKVTTNSGHFNEQSSIAATVTNGLTRSIFTEDMKTGCSIVWLERLDESRSEVGTWERIEGCNAERAPAVVEIGSGQDRLVSLDGAALDVAAGTYRIRFTYRFAAGPEGEEPETIVSDTFTVD